VGRDPEPQLGVLADDPDDEAQLDAFLGAKPASKKRGAIAEEVLEALRARHGLADYVVRNRRGPVGGLPERRPKVFPLEPTEAQDQLIEVGETVMFELARTIDDPRQRYAMLGQLLRALWATPRALSDIIRPISPALVSELGPFIDQVVHAPLDAESCVVVLAHRR